MEKTFKVHVAVVTDVARRPKKEKDRVLLVGKQNELESCTLITGLPTFLSKSFQFPDREL